MPNRLSELFDQRTSSVQDLVPSAQQAMSDMTASLGATSGALAAQISLTTRVRPKVDYSDFKNFVFFNSALDCFNVMGERMINEYPYDGMLDDQLAFVSQSSDYELYSLQNWPSTLGSLKLDGTTQFGYVLDPYSGVSGSGLYPGTGSFTVELWVVIPPMNSLMTLARRGVGCWNIGFTGSLLNVGLPSIGYSVPYGAIDVGQLRYVAFTIDRSNQSFTLYTGSTTSVPSVVFTATTSFSGNIVPSTGLNDFYIGSFSGTSRLYSGSMDELRVWNTARTQQELADHFTSRVWAQDGLIGYWRFNEQTGSRTFRDYSGFKRDGVISGSLGCRTTASLMPGDENEPILDMVSVDLVAYVSTTQVVAQAYDRGNDNVITNLVPSQFLALEDDVNTTVLRDLLFLLARQFDELKVAIDQIPKLLTPSYTGFDEVPDALLVDALKFWGWDTKASFMSKDARQYFFGQNILAGSSAEYSGQRLDTMLFEIKNEFWRRTLQNLAYVYKRKGTREGVEALLRVYGLDEKIVKLKEFGLQPDVGIRTNRINSDRSATAINSSGSLPTTTGHPFTTASVAAVDLPVRFQDSTTLIETGTILSLQYASGVAEELVFTRSGRTGSFQYCVSGSSPQTLLSGVAVFDGLWNNVALFRSSGSATLDIRRINEDAMSFSTASSITGIVAPGTSSHFDLRLGGVLYPSGSWSANNVKAWSVPLSDVELSDHAMNPFSFGTDTPDRQRALSLRWELDNDTDTLNGGPADVSTGSLAPTSGSYLYDRFLFDYNFIAPAEYGWNEEKIRVIQGSRTPFGEHWAESSVLSLEFNLIDALNEDISLMLSSMDNWNNLIGDPANRHRGSYPALNALRRQYFTRLSGRINFRVFADFLDFFDRSFVDLIAQLVPARSDFKGAEFMVESHMLERPKVQYTYRRRNPDLVPEGVILIYQPSFKFTRVLGPAGVEVGEGEVIGSGGLPLILVG
jgi:hypothetical protein